MKLVGPSDALLSIVESIYYFDPSCMYKAPT